MGVVQTVFDHSVPVKKESEYFLAQMEEWAGRDPTAELPKVNFAARVSPQSRDAAAEAIEQDESKLTGSRWGTARGAYAHIVRSCIVVVLLRFSCLLFG